MGARESAIRPGTPHHIEERLLVPALGTTGCNDLLHQHIDRRVRDLQPVELTGDHLAHQGSLFQQIVARHGKEAAFGNGTSPVAGAADPLHGDGDRARGLNLADEVDRADIDTELQRGGGDQDLDLALFQALLGIKTERARERAVVGCHGIRTDALRELKADLFYEPARVDEDQGGAMRLRKGRELVIQLGPHRGGGDGAQLVGGHLDPEVQGAMPAHLHDRGAGTIRMRPGQKIRDQFNGILRRRQTDALRRPAQAGERGPRGQGVFSADKRLQALKTERKMRAAFVIGDRVDLVHNHRVHMAQVQPCLTGGQQQIQRFRRGHQDVRRLLQHGRAILHRGIARAHAGADLRAQIASRQRQLLNLRKWPVEVLLHIVG